jgi:peptidoglycan/xylan/chitin deacetylase (PgdA/CDA1 family)
MLRRLLRVARVAAAVLALGSALPAAAAGPNAGEARVHAPERFVQRWTEGRFEAKQGQGFSWLRVTTDGKAHPAFAATPTPFAPALDLRGKFVRVWVRVEDVRALAGMEFRLSSDQFATGFYAFSIPLFADEEFNFVHSGPWATFTFGFGSARVTGTPDRARIDSLGWVVTDKGAGPAVAELGGMAFEDEPAQGVLSFTFDDGYDEHALVAAPALKKRGFRGTAYVMPEQVGTPGYMTLAQLQALRDVHGWDVAAHHNDPFASFPRDALERVILGTQRFLLANGFRRGAGHLAYPLGKQDPKTVLPLVREHFLTARVASGGAETVPPADWHQLRAFNVLKTTTPDEIQAAVRRAKQHREWLILMFHWLVDVPQRDTDYAVRDFEAVLDRVQAEKIDVRTVSEVWHAAN